MKTTVSQSSAKDAASQRAIEPRIVALARDPDVIYAYWDIPEEGLTTARARLASSALSSRLVVRAHEASGPRVDGSNDGDVLEFDVSDADRDAFLRVARPGSSQVVEIGISAGDGSFVPVARSGRVEMPRALPPVVTAPSADVVRWTTVAPAFAAPGAVVSVAQEFPRSVGIGSVPPGTAVVPAGVAPGWVGGWPSAAGTATSLGGGFGPSSERGASEAWRPLTASPIGTASFEREPLVPPPPAAPQPSISSVTAAAHEPIARLSADPAPALPPPTASLTPDAMTSATQAAGGHPVAAEAVWSPADVSDQEPERTPGGALDRRLLPQRTREPGPTDAVARRDSPPGADQLAAGVAALGRGTLQVVTGALGVASGLVRLGAWAVSKAVERLRGNDRR